MAADYAGAVAATKALFASDWNARTRIVDVNDTPAAPWPPKDADQQLQDWVLIEVVNTTSAIASQGTPGNQSWVYDGLINVHCFTPVGKGIERALANAVAAGEIFRGRKYYDGITPGAYVRSWSPRVDGGRISDDDKRWFRVTATIPFEYRHRG